MSTDDLPLNIPVSGLSEYFQCPICMCQLENVHVTLCGHRFCLPCITETIDRHHCCPCCRKDLTAAGLIKDAHFQELIDTFSNEKEKAEKAYFDEMVATALLEETGTTTAASATGDPFTMERLYSPVEMVLKKHLKQSLIAHHNYNQNVQQSFHRRIQQVKLKHEERLVHLREQCTMGTDLQSQIAIENDHHANELTQLETEMEECAKLAAEAYDRYLDEHIPDPAILPIRVSIRLLSKNLILKDVLIQPQNSIPEILQLVESHMEHLGDKVVQFENVKLVYFSPGSKQTAMEAEDLARSMVLFGATHPHIFALPDDCRPVIQHALHSGGEICVYGTIKLESDMPKRCFVNIFKEGETHTIDYFTCKTCKMNWVCRSCMEVCHSDHLTAPYILDHQPTWPCCYCPKKKKCHILEKTTE